ncbi:unnamed protein product [Vitrella brassicaformis CCMP3155]|uniref:P-type domain-containing protein n=2 Tax=Vitrella brassicaformis TaxID=1169539 RepID=A0A0G4F4I0_VITBC|nr:unnamed protein product [Vitrella brassicaformis CCMP3155]|eukprot:CEM06645.1 unnamed protein product [Vitrella brassicaformis CCMP3155]
MGGFMSRFASPAALVVGLLISIPLVVLTLHATTYGLISLLTAEDLPDHRDLSLAYANETVELTEEEHADLRRLQQDPDIQYIKKLYNNPISEGTTSFYWNLTDNLRGLCHLWPSPPVGKNNIYRTAALPNHNLRNGRGCGMCIEVISNGGGGGHTMSHRLPVGQRLYGYVNNACGTCEPDQIDMEDEKRAGRWQSTWRAVDCFTRGTPVEFTTEPNSGKNFLGVQPRNAPIPFIKVEYFHPFNKKWYNMKFQPKRNYWTLQADDLKLKYPNDRFKAPLQVRLTSLKGEVKVTNIKRFGKGIYDSFVSDPPVRFSGIKKSTVKKGSCDIPKNQRQKCSPFANMCQPCKMNGCCWDPQVGQGIPKCYKRKNSGSEKVPGNPKSSNPDLRECLMRFNCPSKEPKIVINSLKQTEKRVPVKNIYPAKHPDWPSSQLLYKVKPVDAKKLPSTVKVFFNYGGQQVVVQCWGKVKHWAKVKLEFSLQTTKGDYFQKRKHEGEPTICNLVIHCLPS